MRKQTAKKLQLKKAVVARLGQHALNRLAGGSEIDLATEYPTHPCKSIVANVCAIFQTIVVDPTQGC